MVQRRGPRLTAAQKAELWRRWREGGPGVTRCVVLCPVSGFIGHTLF